MPLARQQLRIAGPARSARAQALEGDALEASVANLAVNHQRVLEVRPRHVDPALLQVKATQVAARSLRIVGCQPRGGRPVRPRSARGPRPSGPARGAASARLLSNDALGAAGPRPRGATAERGRVVGAAPRPCGPGRGAWIGQVAEQQAPSERRFTDLAVPPRARPRRARVPASARACSWCRTPRLPSTMPSERRSPTSRCDGERGVVVRASPRRSRPCSIVQAAQACRARCPRERRSPDLAGSSPAPRRSAGRASSIRPCSRCNCATAKGRSPPGVGHEGREQERAPARTPSPPPPCVPASRDADARVAQCCCARRPNNPIERQPACPVQCRSQTARAGCDASKPPGRWRPRSRRRRASRHRGKRQPRYRVRGPGIDAAPPRHAGIAPQARPPFRTARSTRQ